MNIVSLVMSLLGPAIINRIASSLGVNQGIVGKAISAAIPAILAGLANSAGKSGGGSILSQILAKQDPGILGNLGSVLGTPNARSYSDGGLGSLGSLLGGSSTDALTGALGKFSGLGGAESKSLLGTLASVVLGSLAKEQRSSGLDAQGLTRLLEGQKSNIASALPAGFAPLLAGTDLGGVLSGLQKLAAPAAESTPRPAAPSTATPAQPRGNVYPGNNTMYWLLAPAAMAALVLYWLGNRSVVLDAPPPAQPAATSAPTAAPAASLTELSERANSALDGLKAALAGITDEATAKSAMPKLQDTVSQIERIKTSAADLPAEGRGQLAAMVAAALPQISQSIDRVLGIPGVGALLKPILDQVVTTLTRLSTK